MRALVTAALIPPVSFLLASVALADVVELKTGQRIEGMLKQADQISVTVEVGGQTVTFKAEQVRAVYYGTAPDAAPAQPTSRDEALKALNGLHSIVQAGVTYRDYTPRVNDASVIVDRYLRDPGESDSAVKAAIRDAMALYVLAAAAWNARISRNAPSVAADPMVERCPALAKIVAGKPLTGDRYKDIERGVIISFEVPTIWSCASDKTAEAEKLLAAGKK